jgi:S-DNA-T family DNA segregation ATPase FtsK/SpoIIIE
MGKLNNRLKKNFSLTRTQQIMFGVFLILISIIIFSSQISYFNTWRIDQSELSSFFDKTSQTVNIASKFGALISHFLIYMMFGVSSLIFSVLIFVSGLTLFVDANRKKLTERWFWGLIIMIWFSLFFGHFSTNYLYSGTIGYELNEFLNIYIGSIGIISILAFILISYLVIRLNITPEKIYLFIKKLIPKNKEPNKNKEEQTDIKESENEVVTSKFNFKNEEAKPTIQNFSSYAEKKVESRANEDDEIKIEIENNQTEEILDENEIAKGLVKKFGEYDHTLELKNFKPPSIELLNDYDNGGIITINEEELEENKEKIIDTLKNYKIGIDQIKATIGPTVTLYEIIPEAGIRISKIKNLEDDIALSLSALGIRIIAPIPGKGTIGIEVPNKNSTIVSMKSVLASKNYQEAEMELPIALGKNISNETYVVDLAKMPHLLMAGATGQGTSVGLNAVLTSLLYKKHPS